MLAPSALATADTVSLLPTRDNTLYEDVNGLLSNGMGNHFFAGVTAMDEIRRGLILFDVAGNVPAGATIDSVELMLFASRVTNLTARNVSLHRTLNNWGAASSHAADEEGIGRPPRRVTQPGCMPHSIPLSGLRPAATSVRPQVPRMR